MERTFIIIISSLVLTALFAGIEIAFLSSNKFRIELDNKQGRLTAKILSYFVKFPSKFICTILVALNIVLVIYGTYMAETIRPALDLVLPEQYRTQAITLIIETIITTIVLLVAGEFVPKALFRINPNQILGFFAYFIFFCYVILFPVVTLILGITHWILKLIFRIDFAVEKPAFGRIDLDNYLKDISTPSSRKSEIGDEIQMFQNALDFDKLRIRECMVPRTEIIAMSISDPITKLRNRFIETGLSKIMIYRENIDNIIGFVHSYEMFRKPEEIQAVLLPVSIFPETLAAKDLMKHFTEEHRSVAVVVDEYGTTSGIVTIEDVIEEIFGEIQDEHDIEELIEGKTGENEYVFSGRIEVDYINQKYNLNIPFDGEYETLAGFIFHHHEHIPEPNEEILIPPFLIRIQSLKGNRIEQVKLKILSKEE